MGLLASGLYFGNVAGSLVAPILFAKLPPKLVIVVSAIMNALAVGVFTFTDNFWLIFASRVIVGFFQVMFIIYFPVWIDQQAPPAKQTMWISFYFLTVPIGLIVGYGLAIALGDNWKYSFLL